MASTLNFPTETNYITIFDVNSVYSSKLKESLARTKFWKHFSGFHVEGCTEFIRFFEPKLKICDSLLDELQEYEDENWIKSVRKQLDKEFHILNLMKAFNTNYGLLYTKIKGYESKTRYSTEQFEKLLLEEKELQDEVVKCQLKQRADEEELEEQITKVANLCDDYPTSHGYIAPKAKKAGKMANKYTENLKELEEKTAKLIQKSDEVSKRCEKLKREKIKELAKIWKETLTKLERDFRDFRKETLHVKGTHTGLQFAKEIDQESLTATSMKNHEKSFRIPKYQKSSQILDGNKICKNCFKRNNIVLTDEQPEANTTSSNEVHESKKKKAVKSNGARNEDDSAVDKENTSNWKKTPPPIPQRPRLQKPGASNEKAAKNNESSIKTPLPKTSNTKELEEVKPVKTTASEKLKNKRQDKDDATEAMPSKVTKVNRQEKEEPVKLTTSKLTKEMKVEQKEVSGEAVQTTEAQPKSSQTNNDDEKPSTSQSNRKSSTKPVYTKREKLYTQPTPQKKEKRPPFTPYKVTIIRTHKKEAPNEMSVTLGESVKIISAQDDVDYVMATKKLKFFRKKTGLIPIYTF